VTIERAIHVESERYLQECEKASAAVKLPAKSRHLKKAHIHYKALRRLQDNI
jgi:hypothetical protein